MTHTGFMPRAKLICWRAISIRLERVWKKRGVSLPTMISCKSISRTAKISLGNYSEALNILRGVTHKDPESVTAWFNLALTCSKFHLFTEAVNAWNMYLTLDPSSPWADEARQKRHEIEEILNDGKSQSGELPNDSSDLAVEASTRDYITLDQNIESFLNIAVSRWLPRVVAEAKSETTSERRATESVAQVAAVQHQDQWLNAVLAGMNIGRTDNAGGLSSLAEAINASKLGNYSKAKKAAQFAALKFQKSGLIAGLFRADFEGIYASQLLQQGQNCYARSGVLQQQLRGKSYYWLGNPGRTQTSDLCKHDKPDE